MCSLLQTMKHLAVLLIFFGNTLMDDHYIQPTIGLTSCLGRKLILRILNCQSGGLMYVKAEKTAYNMQFTDNGTVTFSCNFDVCKVEWNQPFLFVIQRKVHVQTQHDVLQTFTCIVDQNDIMPDNNANKDLDADNTQVYNFATEAQMMFYGDDGGEIAFGGYIKLGTNVTMVIGLLETYDDLLDINIRSCRASEIVLILDRCPLDASLFQVFNKTAVGVVENLFQMFRTTSTDSAPVNMIFSCQLEVCYAPCTKYICNGTEAVQVERRKRDTTPGQVTRSMSVGILLRVGIEDKDEQVVQEQISCVDLHLAAMAISILLLLTCFTASAFVYYFREWKRQQSLLQSKITETLNPVTDKGSHSSTDFKSNQSCEDAEMTSGNISRTLEIVEPQLSNHSQQTESGKKKTEDNAKVETISTRKCDVKRVRFSTENKSANECSIYNRKDTFTTNTSVKLDFKAELEKTLLNMNKSLTVD